MSDDRLYTTADAATYLGYKTASGVRRAISRGELVPFGVGPRGTHVFKREQLDECCEPRTLEADTPGAPLRRYRCVTRESSD